MYGVEDNNSPSKCAEIESGYLGMKALAPLGTAASTVPPPK